MKIHSTVIMAFLVLTQFVACSNNTGNVNKYAISDNWQTLPQSASQPVDVFFLYPTTYFQNTNTTISPEYTEGWNQSIEQAKVDTRLQAQVKSKASVFYKAGTNLYVPYFQQASGMDVLNALLWKIEPQNSNAANTALEIAYADVEEAFNYYLANYNKDSNGKPRPFILAGHSQGSNLLLMLLERKFTDSALREQLIAAYVIGWSITADDISNYSALSELTICDTKEKTGCIVTYNTQEKSGDFSLSSTTPPTGIVKANAYSVNPLTWLASDPNTSEPNATTAMANLGALFYELQSPVPPQLGPTPDTPPTGKVVPNWTTHTIGGVEVSAVVIDNYTGAQSMNGALVIDPDTLPEPANYKNLNFPYDTRPGWYHNYDYSFFYFNLEQNIIDRIRHYEDNHN